MKLKNIVNLIRWDLVTCRKNYTNAIIGFTAGIALIGLTASNAVLGDMYFAAYILVCIGTLTCISMEMHSKTQRIAILMLPASMNEKLVSRLLLCAVLSPIAAMVCVFVGDGIQYAINSLFTSNPVFGSKIFLNNIMGFSTSMVTNESFLGTHSMWQIWLKCCLYLLTFSYLFACGCVWTKRAIFKGLATAVVCGCIFSIIVSGISRADWTFLIKWLEANDGDTIGYVFGTLLSLIMLAKSILLLWFGHRCFVNRQVIDRKWTNYGF